MGQVERVREELSAPVSLDYLKRKAELGWRPVAIIWERDIGRAEGLAPIMDLDVPYGLKVSTDCSHLEENTEERKVLMLTMELIVQDHPLSRIADELNRQGFRTRAGFRIIGLPTPPRTIMRRDLMVLIAGWRYETHLKRVRPERFAILLRARPSVGSGSARSQVPG